MTYNNHILTGLRCGVDLGFNDNLTPVARNNNKSARENPTEVTKAIIKELSRGHTAGPFPFPPFPVNHISPLGAAPKPDGSCRLVLDLSQPEGLSVNDNIDKLEFPTVYTHFDKATDMVRRLGKGCLLSKIDIPCSDGGLAPFGISMGQPILRRPGITIWWTLLLQHFHIICRPALLDFKQETRSQCHSLL